MIASLLKFLGLVFSILAHLNNAVIWMVPTRPFISRSSSPRTNPLVTVSITIGITATLMFYIFFNSLERSRYLSVFSLSSSSSSSSSSYYYYYYYYYYYCIYFCLFILFNLYIFKYEGDNSSISFYSCSFSFMLLSYNVKICYVLFDINMSI